MRDTLERERTIRTIVFLLLLIGLCGMSAWLLGTYTGDALLDALLKFGSIALCWGVILLVLYVGFKKRDWVWWA